MLMGMLGVDGFVSMWVKRVSMSLEKNFQRRS